MRIPNMSKKPTPPQGKKVPKNLTIDQEIAELFDSYCEANRQSHSVSREVEEFMIATIAKKGRAYGLRLPARFAGQ